MKKKTAKNFDNDHMVLIFFVPLLQNFPHPIPTIIDGIRWHAFHTARGEGRSDFLISCPEKFFAQNM